MSTVRNEADIVGATLAHLYAEGVTDIYIADGMSTDGTRDVLAGFPCKVYDDTEKYHRQPYWSTRLAQEAFEAGADWVLCVDADEFWYAPNGATIAETLELYGVVDLLHAPMFQHLNYDMREPNPKPLPKVAFRARDGVQVANGNHAAQHPHFRGAELGLLAIREIQFRGFEHFVRKIGERCATLDPSLPAYEGTHMTQYRGWSKEQLEPEWEALVAKATVYAPIPVRR